MDCFCLADQFPVEPSDLPTDGHVLALSGLKAKKEIESGHYSFAVDSEAESGGLGKVVPPARQSAAYRGAGLLQIKNHYCNNVLHSP